mgnify:CR=1 FL=1
MALCLSFRYARRHCARRIFHSNKHPGAFGPCCPMSRKAAIIDIGSNTVRLGLCQYKQDQEGGYFCCPGQKTLGSGAEKGRIALHFRVFSGIIKNCIPPRAGVGKMRPRPLKA